MGKGRGGVEDKNLPLKSLLLVHFTWEQLCEQSQHLMVMSLSYLEHAKWYQNLGKHLHLGVRCEIMYILISYDKTLMDSSLYSPSKPLMMKSMHVFAKRVCTRHVSNVHF
jgi:hypothetical protein